MKLFQTGVSMMKLKADKNDFRTKLGQSLGDAKTSCSKSVTDMGRKFPAEHENAHELAPV